MIYPVARMHIQWKVANSTFMDLPMQPWMTYGSSTKSDASQKPRSRMVTSRGVSQNKLRDAIIFVVRHVGMAQNRAPQQLDGSY
jgi:hypothetical protein